MAVTHATITTPNRSMRSRPAASAPVIASAVIPMRKRTVRNSTGLARD